MSTPDASPAPRRWGRLAVFVLAATYMLSGPVYRQVGWWKVVPALHAYRPVTRDALWMRPWMMYRGWGVDLCDVDFHTVLDDGTEAPVDRLSLLGYDGWWAAPLKQRRLRDPDAVRRQAKDVCAKMPVGLPLYVDARCGAPGRGWQPKMDDELVCRGGRR